MEHYTITALPILYLPFAHEVVKVMFLQVCVCPQGGVIPACIAGGIPASLQQVLWGWVSQHALQVSRPTPKGKFWGSVQGVSRPTPKGEVYGDLSGGVVPAPRGKGGSCSWGEGGACSQGGWCGLLLWPSVVVFCCGLLLCPSVMAFWFGGPLIEGSLLVWSSGGQPLSTRRP